MLTFSNTLFWTLFFMIGFAAIFDIIESIGIRSVERFTSRDISVAPLLIGYTLLVIAIVHYFYHTGITTSGTANAVRLGVLMHTSLHLRSWRSISIFSVLTVVLYYPFLHFKLSALAYLAVIVVCMLLVYRFGRLTHKNLVLFFSAILLSAAVL